MPEPATILDWIDGRPHQELENVIALNAAPQATFDHYEKPEHVKAPPPGIPFGYILEVTTCTCSGCGRATQVGKMFAVQRAGYGSAMLACGGSTPIFDRPIKRINRTIGTPACLACIEDLRPHKVDYPVPGAAVGRSKAMADADGSTRHAPAVPTKPTDVASDFM